MDKRISELEKLILKHKNLYYQGRAEISDITYDSLEDELRKLDSHNFVLSMVGGSDLSQKLSNKVEHSTRMLSLNKTYRFDELVKWAAGRSVLSTFKIDGSSCSLVYRAGELKIAKTRGDGRFGENITNKIFFLSGVPKKLCESADIEIRGEVYCTEENFLKLSDAMEKIELAKPSSQRNIVAGLLGRKENIELCEYLSFQAFELISNDYDFKTEKEKFRKMQELSFETPAFDISNSEEGFKAILDETKGFMSSGNYLIDGSVLCFNDLSLHKEMGETAHHPRYKLAFKFHGETKKTKIKSISWQVSRNGYLTPVANVESVELSSAVVSRVTLHNFGIVKQNTLKVGDEIEIIRSGEVIPKFLSVVSRSDNEFVYPEICPSCQEKVYIEDIRLICKSTLCPDKMKDDILNFIKKIGIDDLSSKRLEELIKKGFVTGITSLFTLSREQLLSADKIKEKLADKILTNIENSKSVNLVVFLSSLGITGGAYNKCEKVVLGGFNTIEKVLNLCVAELMLIDSFAEKSAKDFVQSLQSKKEVVEKLIACGFSFDRVFASVKEGPIKGQKFCITGSLSFKRSELQKMVKDNGGVVQSSVNKETSYLITNDIESSSSKFKKAKELEIMIINERKFFKLLEV